VSTAVTRGDLTRSISVEALGEVAELKDNINQMIANLKETTEKNASEDWLKSNLARIGGKMQGQRDLANLCRMIMSEVTPVVEAQQGAFFLVEHGPAADFSLRPISSYGSSHDINQSFASGEGLVGQAALERAPIRMTNVPADYVRIRSGLGEAPPSDIVVLPVLFEEQPLGVIELASLEPFSELHLVFLQQLVETIGVVLNTIIANARTEELLEQSQRLTRELQTQSGELQRTNAELEDKAELLEIKNREIELARTGLEEKAEQLALSSQYKSEFLANMSHELRTPLNSMLLLAKLLADNTDNNLSEQQTEFARTIHAAGTDLLELINDILDLSKVEAGKMDVRPAAVRIDNLCDYVESTFRPLAEEKGLALEIVSAVDVPPTVLTDEQRLQQVLKNLLSNAVKFTETGSVRLALSMAPTEMLFAVPALNEAKEVLAFAVTDTGIGVPADKLRLIFEAFQQADGTTSRKYGGTGLGLSISREIARLLGGSIAVTSDVGKGSTFTLYVPLTYPYGDPGDARVEPDVPTVVDGLQPSVLTQRSTRGTTVGRIDVDALRDTTVLVIDDDVRNVFALTSALEMQGMHVLYADNGEDGIELLRNNPHVSLVLMDFMMPNMDGNEATTMIRSMPRFESLPVIFLTAKAMPGDREKSLAAGASDYITKPVDLDQLLHVMNSWLRVSKPALTPEDA
jgi:signal transduction histidine kinase/ActR/RegA family two-component response regulator